MEKMKKTLLGIVLLISTMAAYSQYITITPEYTPTSTNDWALIYALARESTAKKEAEAYRKAEAKNNVLRTIGEIKTYIINALGQNIDETLRKQLNEDYDAIGTINTDIREHGLSNFLIDALQWIIDDISNNIVSYNNRVARQYEAAQREAEEKQQEWSGTGFALNNGYVVTNYHVVEDAKSITISGINGDFSVLYTASIVAIDKVNDLAIVKISDHRFKGLGILPYAINIRMAEVGDDIFVLGYPLTQTMGDEIKLTNGIISSRTGFQGDAALYQITAPLQPGNSGGPLFDSKGNVVGVICAHHKGTENVGYAIKTSYLKNLAESSSLTNIFPTNNTVSTLPLSGQVKKLKRYVYLIKCSSAIERRNNHEQKTRKGQNSYSSTSPVIVDVEKQNIQIETSAHTFRLTKIEVADGYTKLYKKVIPKSYNTWIRSYREEFIEDAITKEKYYLENSSIEIYPERTILNTNSIVEIVETYPALSKSTKYIYINSGERYYSDQRIKIRD